MSKVANEQKFLADDLKVRVNVSTNIETSLTYEQAESSVLYLLGNVLTLVDASFADAQQRKAVKDLVRKQFVDCQRELSKTCNLNRTVSPLPVVP